MQKRTKGLIAAAVLVASGIGTGSVLASAAGSDAPSRGTRSAVSEKAEDAREGKDVPITGSDLDRAKAVALKHTGEGRVTGTEVEDEESYYEVEVTLDNGDQTDVQLDEDFNVVGEKTDSGS